VVTLRQIATFALQWRDDQASTPIRASTSAEVGAGRRHLRHAHGSTERPSLFRLARLVTIFNQAITALGMVLAIVLEEYERYESWLCRWYAACRAKRWWLLAGHRAHHQHLLDYQLIGAEDRSARAGIPQIFTGMREQGLGRTEALQGAVRVRLRPILMTSATMVFGMLPLALKLEPGAETRAPMAIVVIGALLSSTVLTLVVVPALYTFVDDLQLKLFGAKRRTMTIEEALEQAARPNARASEVAAD
jgi:hypothetical protein